MPLGYEVVMFEKYDKPGGLMRTNIPAFRLPESVLMDEINQILDMGVEIRYNSRHHQHEGAARRKASTRFSSAPARRAARNSTSPAVTTPTASTSASIGWSPSLSATPIRSARRC